MNMTKRILVLYPGDPPPIGEPPPMAQELADALTRRGAAVTLQACVPPYSAVLDAIAAADTVLCWHWPRPAKAESH
jgi:hypothetical protein